MGVLKTYALRFSECSNNCSNFSHSEGVLPSFFKPPAISRNGKEDILLPVVIDFIDNYLWLLCRVAKPERYGGDGCDHG